jgi:hypothetical protein
MPVPTIPAVRSVIFPTQLTCINIQCQDGCKRLGRCHLIPNKEDLHMFTGKRSLAFLTFAALVCAPIVAHSQSASDKPAHVPLQRTIGQVNQTKVVPSLIVFNSQGATLQDGKLVLTGVAPNSIIFADRPVRAAGHDLTANIIDDWGTGADNFKSDPPNATVSGFSKEGDAVADAVVTLKSPVLEGDKLTFDVDVLEGDLAGADGAAAVFIDIIGRPLPPLSYAGAARRMGRRGAFYAGAAVGAAGAAYGAYGPYGPPRCGYYPYPPCY